MSQRSTVWSEMQRHRIMTCVLESGVVDIRNVVAGEAPVPYTSRHFGPVYIGIKELIGWPLLDDLITFLADKVRKELPCPVRFLVGTATGAIVPSYEIAKKLRRFWNRKGVPSGYVRDQAKNNEWLVGVRNNPLIQEGDSCLLIEELINFGETTVRSVRVLREAGYKITHVACFLWYENPCAIKALKREGLEVLYLFTLPQLLDRAEKSGLYARELLDQCREFLRDPIGWEHRHVATFPHSFMLILDDETGKPLGQAIFGHSSESDAHL